MAVVSREDWSLHRKGQQAQARHKEKVKAAIRENLRDVITDEGLVMSDGKQVVRIPVHSLDEPHFHFNHSKQQHVGQGQAEKGQVIGRSKAQGEDGNAGDGPGDPMVEAEVTLEDIEEILFANLELPNLMQKPKTAIVVEDEEWTDVRKRGIQSNLDRKRTFIEALKRSQRQHSDLQITQDDLRFRTYEETTLPHTGAVIFAMMDISASMGEFEKYIARTFFFWMERFLAKHYPHVDIRYLVHHTEAKEVSQADFFRLKESGGTRCSSVYSLALEVIEREYPTDAWNIYPIHVSDGDNYADDNHAVTGLVRSLCEQSSLVGYLEVHSHQRPTTLSQTLDNVEQPVFRSVKVSSKEGVLKALSHFFHKGDAVEQGVAR